MVKNASTRRNNKSTTTKRKARKSRPTRPKPQKAARRPRRRSNKTRGKPRRGRRGGRTKGVSANAFPRNSRGSHVQLIGRGKNLSIKLRAYKGQITLGDSTTTPRGRVLQKTTIEPNVFGDQIAGFARQFQYWRIKRFSMSLLSTSAFTKDGMIFMAYVNDPAIAEDLPPEGSDGTSLFTILQTSPNVRTQAMRTGKFVLHSPDLKAPGMSSWRYVDNTGNNASDTDADVRMEGYGAWYIIADTPCQSGVTAAFDIVFDVEIEFSRMITKFNTIYSELQPYPSPTSGYAYPIGTDDPLLIEAYRGYIGWAPGGLRPKWLTGTQDGCFTLPGMQPGQIVHAFLFLNNQSGTGTFSATTWTVGTNVTILAQLGVAFASSKSYFHYIKFQYGDNTDVELSNYIRPIYTLATSSNTSALTFNCFSHEESAAVAFTSTHVARQTAQLAKLLTDPAVLNALKSYGYVGLPQVQPTAPVTNIIVQSNKQKHFAKAIVDKVVKQGENTVTPKTSEQDATDSFDFLKSWLMPLVDIEIEKVFDKPLYDYIVAVCYSQYADQMPSELVFKILELDCCSDSSSESDVELDSTMDFRKFMRGICKKLANLTAVKEWANERVYTE
jgi:hypothetical protein